MGAGEMRTSPLTDSYNRWTQPSYEVRVRGTMYLWGSAEVTHNIRFAKPLVLHILNDTFGEAITFGTRVASGTQTTLGTLKPGQCISLPVHDISGIFATCEFESTVCCVIKE